MNFYTLKQELDLPAYDSLSDADATSLLNTVDILRNLPSINGSILLEAQDAADYIGLSDSKKTQWLSLCALSSIDPFGAAVDAAIDIWGVGTSTITNLNSIRRETISRATELGLPVIKEENVRYARTL